MHMNDPGSCKKHARIIHTKYMEGFTATICLLRFVISVLHDATQCTKNIYLELLYHRTYTIE